MKKKAKVAIFWLIAIALISLFVASDWAIYSQFASGLGQEPSLFGFIGWALN